MADNIRRLVMAKELVRKSTNEIIGRVTVSIGVASLGENDTAASLFERADQCLYAAKKAAGTRSWQKTILSFRRLLRSDKRKLGVPIPVGSSPIATFQSAESAVF